MPSEAYKYLLSPVLSHATILDYMGRFSRNFVLKLAIWLATTIGQFICEVQGREPFEVQYCRQKLRIEAPTSTLTLFRVLPNFHECFYNV